MPNINAVVNEQIRRLARREINTNTRKTRKASAHNRRDIAALKRAVSALTKQVAALRKRMPDPIAANVPDALLQKSRLRVDGLKAHRLRLGLSAKDYGKLFDVSSLTIYNWENGKAKPRRSLLPRLVAVRGMGKREAYEKLGFTGKPGSGPRGRYKQTAVESILQVVKSRKNLSTRDMNAAWKEEGRAGTADVLLGRLVKEGKLRRTKVKGERGSRYSVA